MNSSDKAYLSGALGVGTSRIVGLGAGFLSLLLLTRILSKEDFASYAVAYSVVILLGHLVGIGLERSLVVDIGRLAPAPDRLLGARLMRQVATVALTGSVVAVGGIVVIAALDYLETGIFLTRLAPVVPATALSTVLVAWYQANHRPGIGMAMQGLNDATRCAIFSIALFAGWGPSGVIGGAIIGALAPVLALGLGALGRCEDEPGTISRATWINGLQFQLVRLSRMGFQHLDLIALGAFGTPAATAQYVVASRFAFLIESGLSLFSPTFAPRVRRHFETNELHLAEREYKTARVLGLTGALLLAVVFLAVGRSMLELVSGFEAGFTPFLILIGANLLTVGFGLSTVFLSYTDKLYLTTLNKVFSLLLFVVLLFVLVPWKDAIGAALACFIAIAVRDFSSLMLMQRHFEIRPVRFVDLVVVLTASVVYVMIAFGLVSIGVGLALQCSILATEVFRNRAVYVGVLLAGRTQFVSRNTR